jgi:hypothetical protein
MMILRACRRLLPPALSIVGMLLLSFILGAGVIRFKLPTSQFLLDAFEGAEAWANQQKELADLPSGEPNHSISNHVDIAEKTFDGFTLYTTGIDSEARLMNMRGEVVHYWHAPFRKVWPQATHVRLPVPDDKIYLFGCYLYANGDLLVIYHGTGDTPYGYGLAKLDKDSNVLWKYSANAHHAVDVGPDGTIYVLTHRIIHELPAGLESFTAPALADSLVLLSPDGHELKTISLLEALRDSPYGLSLVPGENLADHAWDIMHANFVEVLRPELAGRFPMFRAGQVLVSLRELDTLAMIDPQSGSVAWAGRGPWHMQHDPHFLDNGRILVFDNRGAIRKSRVLEYDPQTQACPWCYSGSGDQAFYTAIQGRSQRLPNGNTLVVDSFDGNLMEVTAEKELVWSCNCHVHVPFAQRYAADQLTFLKGDIHARP